nr:MAG TPA: Protein of unknown function (DUF2829) [Caudoviricetes sp.]
MKTWEALKAADEGKKIRRSGWVKGMYIYKDESSYHDKPIYVMYRRRIFGSQNIESFRWDEMFVDDWEIYKEE